MIFTFEPAAKKTHYMLFLGWCNPPISIFGAEFHFLGFDLALILAGLLSFNSLIVLELTIVP